MDRHGHDPSNELARATQRPDGLAGLGRAPVPAALGNQLPAQARPFGATCGALAVRAEGGRAGHGAVAEVVACSARLTADLITAIDPKPAPERIWSGFRPLRTGRVSVEQHACDLRKADPRKQKTRSLPKFGDLGLQRAGQKAKSSWQTIQARSDRCHPRLATGSEPRAFCPHPKGGAMPANILQVRHLTSPIPALVVTR